jgi:hypothetical protein
MFKTNRCKKLKWSSPRNTRFNFHSTFLTSHHSLGYEQLFESYETPNLELASILEFVMKPKNVNYIMWKTSNKIVSRLKKANCIGTKQVNILIWGKLLHGASLINYIHSNWSLFCLTYCSLKSISTWKKQFIIIIIKLIRFYKFKIITFNDLQGYCHMRTEIL